MADKQDREWRRGIMDGENAALDYPGIRTHSLHPPAGRPWSRTYQSAYRVGMGNVRNLTVCRERLEAGQEEFRPQVELMAAKIAADQAELAGLCDRAEGCTQVAGHRDGCTPAWRLT